MSSVVDVINIQTDFNAIREELIDEYLDQSQNFPWIVTFSGGKDSTLVAHLVFDILLELPPNLRTRQIYFVSNDTLVESPLVVSHMKKTLAQILKSAKILKLPIDGEITTPKVSETFWSLLIGKGYPSPNRGMRWCTDRLKIQPTSQYILNKVSEHGEVILLLGVRKDESTTRKASIESHQNLENSNLTPHTSLKNAYVYRPIVDISTDEVWEFLVFNNPPWGGSHRDLVQLYRDAKGGECPLILSEDDAPSCGTNSSRFGCWTCTVVTKDKSLQGFVDVGKTEFQPLLDFRDWLVEIRNDEKYRQYRRRNGQITMKNGKLIPGPFTIEARQMIFERLMQVQDEFGEELISPAEIEFIKRTWAEDVIENFERSKA
ncbi:DNA phosphorothioation system sulfurtransferase DndC [Moraxella nasibovis]|uniref:DNA phosphorothioation system sulfurtransferase DndC n=1 Tax=Moraxella nasibovis TaxID=2904120 RepID=UPI00240F7393|nr:DNA phosphorothioation system sulfurtransferase DndC [Moraxella nasibovis]WFF38376.1 DNA phosphorothioation system sulfurtransferase DndC [Moraxella nasibovis]